MGNEIIFSICWHCLVCNLTRSSSVYGILSDFPSYNVGLHTKFHTNSVVLLLQSNWSGSGTSDAFLVCSYPFTLLECLSKVLDKSAERKTKVGCRPKCTITIIYHHQSKPRIPGEAVNIILEWNGGAWNHFWFLFLNFSQSNIVLKHMNVYLNC